VQKLVQPPLGIRLLFLGLLAAAMGILYYYRDRLELGQIQSWILGVGVWGVLLFISIYAVGTVLLFTTSLLTLAGGALFGPLLGSLYNLAGATSGAMFAFLIARYLTADWLQRRAGGRLKQLSEGVEREGWRYVAMVRLVPIVSPNFINYLLGLTATPLPIFIVITYICLLPGTIAYTYLGYAGAEALTDGKDLIGKGLLALSVVILVDFVPRLLGMLGIGISIHRHNHHR
jgi:uncharacterized membrane protein YdjX (TVP38/TMEM64 family)